MRREKGKRKRKEREGGRGKKGAGSTKEGTDPSTILTPIYE
jgi:hypothetical protein